MARLIINNKGIATVLAISIMIFIASIAVAVIPNINNLLKQNSLSADMLKAQIAAETGAKRAIAELYQGKDGDVSYSWIWLKNDCNLQGNNNSNGSYNVTITGATNLTGTVKPTSGKYTITSTGKYGTKTKTIKCDVEIVTGENTFRFLAFSPKEIAIGAIALGDILSKDSISINFLSISGSLLNGKSDLYTPGKKNISLSLAASLFSYNKKDANDIFGNNLNNYPTIKKFDNTFYDNFTQMPATQIATGYRDIEPGKYQVNGDLNILLLNALNLNRNGSAFIHVKGDLNLGVWSRIGHISEEYKNFLIIVDGDVNISTNAGINNAVIISYGSVNIGNMSNITGSIQALNGIYASQGLLDITPVTLLYNEKAVAPFLQYASFVNYGSYKVYKVSNWR